MKKRIDVLLYEKGLAPSREKARTLIMAGCVYADNQKFDKPGDTVRAGQKLMTLHTDTPERFDRALAALDGGWTIGPAGSTPDLLPLVIDRIAQ